MTERINKKLGKLRLPKSSNWMVYDLKKRIRRVKQEMSLGNYSDQSSLLYDIEEMGSELLRLRQLESDYVKRSSHDLNEGRKRHQFHRTQDEICHNKNVTEWVFSRKYMKKTYNIDNGLTIFIGDEYRINGDANPTSKYHLLNVSQYYGKKVVNLRHVYHDDTRKAHEEYISVDIVEFDKKFKLYSVFIPDFSGGLPNQCPSCEDEIYYYNGGFHAYDY